MGISGLLPFLEQATKPCHLSEFKYATVAVDTYCWLHKAVSGCAVQLAASGDSRTYVNYCLRYVKMLQSYNIRPILVFDGKNLPAKAKVDKKRRESRTNAREKATELLKLGKTAEAEMYLKQSINITPEIASAVIKECHKINVDCIVAPYESDAQLAFFNLKGIADFVITEDSDLLLFGCSKVIFKLDMRGCGYLVESDKIHIAMKLRPDQYTFEKFCNMCILSGCDYIASLHGIGLKKALKFVSMTEETNPEVFLDRLPRYLNMRQLKVTDEYKENFMVAKATFRHQTVFDPVVKKLEPLTNPEVCGTNLKYCKNAGDIFDNEIAYQVALGNLHPSTFKRMDNWSPSGADLSTVTIWSKFCRQSVFRKEQKTKFKEFFKSSVKVAVNTEDKDEENKKKIIEEKQTSRELEYYFCESVKSNETKRKDVVTETARGNREGSVSPVLNTNPFIRRKKLSKFALTKLDNKVIVKSRYFTSSSKQNIEIKEADTKDNEMFIVQNSASEVNSAFSSSETNVCNVESNSKTKDASYECTIQNEKNCVIDLTEERTCTSNTTKLEYKATGQCSKTDFSQRSGTDSSILKRKMVDSHVVLKRPKFKRQQRISNFFSKAD